MKPPRQSSISLPDGDGASEQPRLPENDRRVLVRKGQPLGFNLTQNDMALHERGIGGAAHAGHRVGDGVTGPGVAVEQPGQQAQMQLGRVRETFATEVAVAQTEIAAQLKQLTACDRRHPFPPSLSHVRA